RGALCAAFGIERALPVAGAAALTGVLVMGTGVKLVLGGLAAALFVATTFLLDRSPAPPVATASRTADAAVQPPVADGAAAAPLAQNEMRERAPALADGSNATICGRCVDEHGVALRSVEVKVEGWAPSFSLERAADATARQDWKPPANVQSAADGAFA